LIRNLNGIFFPVQFFNGGTVSCFLSKLAVLIKKSQALLSLIVIVENNLSGVFKRELYEDIQGVGRIRG
jgi:hypothetical protein